MPPPQRACRHTFLHDLLPLPPRAGYAVTAEMVQRLPVRAGTRAEACLTARGGVRDELHRVAPRAALLQLRNDRPGASATPPIHAKGGGGGAEMVAGNSTGF